MKSLFSDAYEYYIEEGLNLANEIEKAIEPVIEKYQKLGFSIRDIEYISDNAVHTICAEKIIMRNFRIHKEKMHRNFGEENDSKLS